MTRQELSDEERAYRRGVHQAFAMLDDAFREARFAVIDAHAAITLANLLAHDFRWSPEAHPLLLDELKEMMRERLWSAAKAIKP